MIQERFTGKYIELDVSENLELKSPILRSKMLTFLVSSILFIFRLLNLVKINNHPSDNTNHDPILANEVLEDIFKRWEIKEETTIIKSDSAPTQYKNLHSFKSMQNLSG